LGVVQFCDRRFSLTTTNPDIKNKPLTELFDFAGRLLLHEQLERLMRLISMRDTTQRFGLGMFVTSLLFGLPTYQAAAAPAAIVNPSFELPDAGGAWNTAVPDGWVGSPGLSNAFVESSASVGFTGGDGAQYAGLDTAGSYIYQDLGIAFAPNTKYTIDLAGAHRSGFGHGKMEFGLWSGDAIGTDIGTPGFMDLQGVWSGSGNPDADDTFNALRDASAVHAIGSGALGDVYSYSTIGSSVPAGNVVLFIRDTTGNRINFDNARLDVTAVPEPTSVLLLAGCAILAAGRKRL
jgi:hypothetical protein